MLKDPEPETLVHVEEKPEETTLEILELDPQPSLPERLFSWIDSVDR